MKNNAELISALNVISKQRGISVDILADAIESALVSAYKKNYNVNCNVRANPVSYTHLTLPTKRIV